MTQFTLKPGNQFIWNSQEFLKFLISNQGQDILISTNQEGCCLYATGVYQTLDLFKFKSVTINTANCLETHEHYAITQDKGTFKFFDVQDTDRYKQYHNWNKSKVFGALYNRALWHRIGLASHLLANHAEHTMINFRYNPHDINSRELFELQELFEYDMNSMVAFSKIVNQLPVQLESQDGYTVGATTQQHSDQLAEFYQNFFVDIVAETFTSGNCFFATEKTVRPMLLKKPFVVFGSKDYLVYLRQMGFRTFGDFWDETYDGYEAADRLLKIQSLIDSIAQKSMSELQKMYQDMQYTLDHNYNLLMTQTYQTKITQL